MNNNTPLALSGWLIVVAIAVLLFSSGFLVGQIKSYQPADIFIGKE